MGMYFSKLLKDNPIPSYLREQKEEVFLTVGKSGATSIRICISDITGQVLWQIHLSEDYVADLLFSILGPFMKELGISTPAFTFNEVMQNLTQELPAIFYKADKPPLMSAEPMQIPEPVQRAQRPLRAGRIARPPLPIQQPIEPVHFDGQNFVARPEWQVRAIWNEGAGANLAHVIGAGGPVAIGADRAAERWGDFIQPPAQPVEEEL